MGRDVGTGVVLLLAGKLGGLGLAVEGEVAHSIAELVRHDCNRDRFRRGCYRERREGVKGSRER